MFYHFLKIYTTESTLNIVLNEAKNSTTLTTISVNEKGMNGKKSRANVALEDLKIDASIHVLG
jgi:hypothetical protein